MGIKGTGALAHIFHGTKESARIAIDFSSDGDAFTARMVLGPKKWFQAIGHRNLILASCTAKDLAQIKSFFKEKCNLKIIPCGFPHCKDQCASAEIDNLNHSIDRGAAFTVEIPDPNNTNHIDTQLSLPKVKK